MENLKIEVEETKNYKQRMSPLLWISVILIGLLLYLSFAKQEVVDYQIYMVVLLAILTFSFDDTCAYFIMSIEINANQMHITYKKRNEQFEINDSIEKFTFKSVSYRNSNSLIIKYNDKAIIKQYRNWQWKKTGAFDKTILFLRNNKLLS